MGDVGETWKVYKERRRQQKQAAHEHNMNVLNASEFEFAYRGVVVLFREKNKPKVDFYPSTGVWKVGGKAQRVSSGGAAKFLAWYRRQNYV